MADITLCINKRCPLRKSCRRADHSQAGNWQSWAHFEFHWDGAGYAICLDHLPKYQTETAQSAPPPQAAEGERRDG